MKRLKLIGCLVALFAVVCVNVWNAATSFRGSELSVADVEAMANSEGQDGTGRTDRVWLCVGGDGMIGPERHDEYDGSWSLRTVYFLRYQCQLRQYGYDRCNVGEMGSGQSEFWTFYDRTGHMTYSSNTSYTPGGRLDY